MLVPIPETYVGVDGVGVLLAIGGSLVEQLLFAQIQALCLFSTKISAIAEEDGMDVLLPKGRGVRPAGNVDEWVVIGAMDLVAAAVWCQLNTACFVVETECAYRSTIGPRNED